MAPRLTKSQGKKPDKSLRDALLLALNREATDADGKPTKKITLLADKVVDKAIEGDVPAIKEVFDRVLGKAPQHINVSETPFDSLSLEEQQAFRNALAVISGDAQDDAGGPEPTHH